MYVVFKLSNNESVNPPLKLLFTMLTKMVFRVEEIRALV